MADRLKRLQELATQHQDDAGETAVDVEVDEAEAADETEMRDFFQRVKRVQDALQVITSNIDTLSQKHKDLLVSVNKSDQDKIKTEVQLCMDTISRNANRVRQELKAIEEENGRAEKKGVFPDGTVATDLRIRKHTHSQLTKAFVKVMTRYNDVQAENKKKYTDNVRRQCQVVNPEISEDAVQQVVEHGTTEGLFTGRRLADAEAALEEIQDRHRDIQNLEKSLRELHEMFLDMALLVESQGEMIDRIEFAVEQSHNYVRAAAQDVKKAHTYQSKARTKLLCIIFCVLILVIILVATLAT